MTLLDALCSEYGWPLDYVFFDLPLCVAFALFQTISLRYDVQSGPTFAEQEMIEALNALAVKGGPRGPARGHGQNGRNGRRRKR